MLPSFASCATGKIFSHLVSWVLCILTVASYNGQLRLHSLRLPPCSDFTEPFFAFECSVNIQHFDERCALGRPWLNPWSVCIQFQALPHMQPALLYTVTTYRLKHSSRPPTYSFSVLYFTYFLPLPFALLLILVLSIHNLLILFLCIAFPALFPSLVKALRRCSHISLISFNIYSSTCSVFAYIFFMSLMPLLRFFHSPFFPADKLLSFPRLLHIFPFLHFFLLAFLFLILFLPVFSFAIFYLLLLIFFSCPFILRFSCFSSSYSLSFELLLFKFEISWRLQV